MRAVALALRGLWWRRSASLVIGFVAVVCTAVAAAGPAYAAAAGDAVVQTTLRAAPADGDGTGLSVSRRSVVDKPSVGALRADVGDAFAALVAHDEYAPAVLSIQSAAHVDDLAGETSVTAPVVYRQDVCAHLAMTAGTCSRVAGAALISTSTAKAEGWAVGTVLPFVDFGPKGGFPQLRVAGIYTPVDPDGSYWFAGTHDYFDSSGATDAVFVDSTTWTVAPAGAVVSYYADLAFRPGAVHLRDLDALADRVRLAAAVLRASPGGDASGDIVTTSLPSVIFSARLAADQVSAPVTSVVVQLLVLTFAVLFLLMVASYESRGTEVALGKLRGLSLRAAVSHALLEPTLLLIAAVPLGVGVATVVLHTGAPSVVGSDAVVAIGATSWLAALGAGVAGVVAGLAASVSVLRRPVLAQWQRTERRPRRIGWIVEAVVVVLALTATSQLLGKANGSGRFAFLPSAAPALLAIAFALIGARVLPLFARAGFSATRASRFVAVFVALRQLARRRGGLRTFGVVCVSVALVVFGLCSHVVFQDNREARATAEVGAPRVVQLQPTPAGTDVTAVVDRLDPSGTQATAVFQGSYVQDSDGTLSTGGLDFDPPTSSTLPTLMVVDPDRFARVASWTAADNRGRGFADTARPLSSATPTFVRLQGTTLHVAGSVRSSTRQPVVLRAGFTDAVGAAFEVGLGTVVVTPVRSARWAPPQPSTPPCPLRSATTAACCGS